MALLSRERLATVRDSPAVREYGSLFVLLVASMLLNEVLTAGVDAVADLPPTLVDPRLVGAAVYASLGVVGLAVVYVAALSLGPSERGVDRHELLELVGAAALVGFFAAYLLHDAMELPLFPGDVVTALLSGGVAMAILAVVYNRVRGIDGQFDLPDRDAVPIAVVVTLTAVLGGVVSIAAYIVSDHAFLGTRTFLGGLSAPQLTAGLLLSRVVVPGALVGFGMGVLYNGAVQEALRRREGPTCAAAAMVPLVVLSPVSLGGVVDPFTTAAIVVGSVVLSLLGAYLAVRGTVVLSRSWDRKPTPVVGASVGVLVGVLPLLGLLAVGLMPVSMVPAGLATFAVVAVAAVGYERSRSVWVPGLAFAVFVILLDENVVAYVASVFG